MDNAFSQPTLIPRTMTNKLITLHDILNLHVVYVPCGCEEEDDDCREVMGPWWTVSSIWYLTPLTSHSPDPLMWF